uniref:Uncharacterized protein n=1 Tax=Anguilla anguilla TaxID=7936 RepID=A0A0E9SKQ7_ANGAN
MNRKQEDEPSASLGTWLSLLWCLWKGDIW